MTVRSKKLASANHALVANTVFVVYTVPAGHRAIVKDWIVKTSVNGDILVAANNLAVLLDEVPGFGVPAVGNLLRGQGRFVVLEAGDTLEISNSVNCQAYYHFSGAELVV